MLILIECFTKKLVKNGVRKKYTHVDTILTVYRNLPLPITNTLSNTHNNTIPQVDYYKTNLSTSYCAD